MISMKKLSIAAAFLILIGAAGSLATFGQRDKLKSVSESKSIPAASITDISVQAENAKIEILPTTGPDIQISLKGKVKSKVKNPLGTTVEGHQLTIKENTNTDPFFNLSFDFYEPKSIKVLLPKKDYQSFSIENDNGNVSLKDASISSIHARTNNGQISLSALSAKETDAEADNGEIIFNHVTGKIKAITNNGKLSLKTEELNQPVQLESDNGAILITTEKEPDNVTFDTSVDNGKVNIFNKYQGNAVIGNGKTLIKLKTNNGEIKVSK
ncbi:DUF4097 domain-containing protein [Metabacillus sp. GX 13764]|uniref:DUF4097 family beta strand repeat-containing protein n=1 Tax=Metabacillus kandeliae TaxID=2900151 RepID=UPI001E57B50E|nr:DUF4097 family beta strand repeat-containing protein [Metabacillus kandeliae]MCD7034259.1 DUF4097 domain-containing protein [Metabacillus kandeliae]